MSVVPDIVPISELRQHAAGMIKKMKASRKPIFITQRGRAAAVMMSSEAYERTQHELDILRVLARGEVDIDTGVGHDMESVFEEADRLLSSAQ